MQPIVMNAIEHVRQNPAMYLGREDVVPDILATFVANDALVVGASRVVIERTGGWWIVTADIDWLSAGHHLEMNELFTRFVPLASGGQNALRREPLLMAFAANVVTCQDFDREPSVIKGSFDARIIEHVSRGRTGWKRLLAFQLPAS